MWVGGPLRPFDRALSRRPSGGRVGSAGHVGIGVSPQVIARLLPCPLHGLDVPQAKITAWVISAEAASKTNVKLAEFGGFQRDRQALAQWLARFAFEFL